MSASACALIRSAISWATRAYKGSLDSITDLLVGADAPLFSIVAVVTQDLTGRGVPFLNQTEIEMRMLTVTFWNGLFNVVNGKENITVLTTAGAAATICLDDLTSHRPLFFLGIVGSVLSLLFRGELGVPPSDIPACFVISGHRASKLERDWGDYTRGSIYRAG